MDFATGVVTQPNRTEAICLSGLRVLNYRWGLQQSREAVIRKTDESFIRNRKPGLCKGSAGVDAFPTAGQETGATNSRSIAAVSGSQFRGACRLIAGARGIEEVEEAADCPISRRDAKYEGTDDGQQEQGCHKKCHHVLLIASDAPGARPDVSSATPYLCTTLARIDVNRC